MLGGAGVAWLARGRAGRAGVLAARVVALVAAPAGAARAADLAGQARDARARVALSATCAAVAALGGPAAFDACRRPAVNEEVQTALAWHLGRHLAGVNVRPHPADVVLRAPPSELAGELPRRTALPPAATPLADAGPWEVLLNAGVAPEGCGEAPPERRRLRRPGA